MQRRTQRRLVPATSCLTPQLLLTRVCVCVLQPVYRKLLPLYFPRSEEEERACRPLVPADIGNSEGEPIVPERQIRISEKPGVLEGERPTSRVPCPSDSGQSEAAGDPRRLP